MLDFQTLAKWHLIWQIVNEIKNHFKNYSMKRFLILIFFVLTFSNIFATKTITHNFTPPDSCDIIIFKSGDELEVKVYEVTDTQIKYKKFNFLSGPIYVANKNDIFLIKYSNGDKDVFNNNTTQANSSTNQSQQQQAIDSTKILSFTRNPHKYFEGKQEIDKKDFRNKLRNNKFSKTNYFFYSLFLGFFIINLALAFVFLAIGSMYLISFIIAAGLDFVISTIFFNEAVNRYNYSLKQQK